VNVVNDGPAGKRKVNRKDAPMLGINAAPLAATAAAAKSGGFNPSTLILILIVVVAFYLLMIRPQQRRKQQAAQKQNTVQPGARVRTTAGMYATVVEVDGDDLILEVAPGVEVRYMKRAVMDVVSEPETVDEVDEVDEEEAPVDETDTDLEDEQFPETAVHDDDEHAGTAPGSAHDAEETAYEQATGSKQD
jgi:preprotein translocase YajC subunit